MMYISGVNASSRLGGRSAEGDGPLTISPPPGRGLGGANFCDLEMACFGDSEGLNLKVFFLQKL